MATWFCYHLLYRPSFLSEYEMPLLSYTKILVFQSLFLKLIFSLNSHLCSCNSSILVSLLRLHGVLCGRVTHSSFLFPEFSWMFLFFFLYKPQNNCISFWKINVDFFWDAIAFTNQLSEDECLYGVVPIQEYGICFYLFRFSFMSFRSIFKAFCMWSSQTAD